MKLNHAEVEQQKLKDMIKEKQYELESIREMMQPQIDSLRKQINEYEMQIHKIKQYENVWDA